MLSQKIIQTMSLFSITSVCVLSVVFHLVLLLYGELHDRTFPVVRYTDVDYDVFTDATDFVAQGSSPFDRTTYRYTPLLAWILYPGAIWNKIWGKIVFCTSDVLVGLMSYYVITSFVNVDTKQQKKKRKKGKRINNSVAVWSVATWLLNPMAVVVSSRGNAESLVALTVLSSLVLVLRRSPLLAGLMYGVAVHFKIYPVIYCMSFYFAFVKPGALEKALDRRSYVWNLFVPNGDRLKFVASSLFSFFTLTVFFYYVYGERYLEEAFYYHFRRSDVKHNFSAYFYLLYLSAANQSMDWLSYVAFVPQAVLVALISLRYHDICDLPFALFLETFTFVAFNKVCTSQYFLWFLCLLPTFIARLTFEWSDAIKVVILWVSSQAAWLYAAYLLEFRGMDTFVYIWIASLGFLISNVYAIRFFIDSYKVKA